VTSPSGTKNIVATKIIMFIFTEPSRRSIPPIHAHREPLVHLWFLCKLAHARAKIPSDTMYCEPLNCTASIIVMLCMVCLSFRHVTYF